MKLGKSSYCYLGGLFVLSVIQLILIYSLLTSEQTVSMQTELYVDGADFSPWLSLAQTGLNSIVYSISVIVDTIIGSLLSFITMRILRRFALRSFTEQTKKVGIIITLVCGIIFFLIACILAKFHTLIDLCILYTPVPVTSFLAYHIGRKPKQK